MNAAPSLLFADGSGAASRRVLGTTIIGGMLAAVRHPDLLIPATFNLVEKLMGKTKAAHQTVVTSEQQLKERTRDLP
jgi:hypothetical protein